LLQVFKRTAGAMNKYIRAYYVKVNFPDLAAVSSKGNPIGRLFSV
jgi:hypothetical protein